MCTQNKKKENFILPISVVFISAILVCSLADSYPWVKKLLANLASIATIIATIAAALIAAGYSTYNTRKQAEIKIAENRQVWVNSLREAFARYLSCVRQELSAKNRENKSTHKDNNVNDIQHYSSFILLLMNNNDGQYEKLKLLMEYLNNVCHSDHCSQFLLDEAYTAVYHLETLAQCILKIEWNRIKDELHMSPKANEYYNEKVYDEEAYKEKIGKITCFIKNIDHKNACPGTTMDLMRHCPCARCETISQLLRL